MHQLDGQFTSDLLDGSPRAGEMIPSRRRFKKQQMLSAFAHNALTAVIDHKWRVVVIAGAIIALLKNKGVLRYWLKFTKRLILESWSTWKQKLFVSTATAVFAFAVRQSKGEPGAAVSLFDSLLAVAVVLAGWVVYHAVSVAALLQQDANNKTQSIAAKLKALEERQPDIHAITGINVDVFYVGQLRKFEGHKQVRRNFPGRTELSMQPAYADFNNFSHVIVDLWFFNVGGLATTLWDFRLSTRLDGKDYIGRFLDGTEGCYVVKQLLPQQPLSSTNYSQPSVDLEITPSNPLTRSSPRHCWAHFAFEHLQPMPRSRVLFDLEYSDASEKRHFAVMGDLLPVEICQDS